ncbi:MAG: HD domain-containing protein [Candidatus Dojkabacteria bacterium]|nr:MAG: HD domain-containing protein [Candidatus Dojkabacteria bacterium]
MTPTPHTQLKFDRELLPTALAELTRESEKVNLALNLVYTKLSGKVRGNVGDNAFYHACRVANYILTRLGIRDIDTVVSAILHDAVEEFAVTTEAMHNVFGPEITSNVRCLTRSKYSDTKQPAKTFQKASQNWKLADASLSVKIIKLSDRIDNLQGVIGVSSSDPRSLKIPYWIIETRLSLLHFAKATHQLLYEDLIDVVKALEYQLTPEESELVDHYLRSANIPSDIRKHLQEYAG